MEPVIFEDDSPEYLPRTSKNARWSDITLAFAVNPESQGELDTRNAAGEKFIGIKLPEHGNVNISDAAFMQETADTVISLIRAREDFQSINRKGILLNVAGNRLSILVRSGIDQSTTDRLLEHILREMVGSGINIVEIRSGGQSGVDEAGIHAAQTIGIRCSILCPKGYRFSDSDGIERSGSEDFCARFRAL